MEYDGGNSSNTQNNSQLPPNAFEVPLDISSLTAGEHRIYDYLHAHGWSEDKCSFYFSNAKAMQESLVQYFRAQGWSEGQLEAFNEACHSELPEQLSAPPGDGASDYEWQVKMVEEMNRRKRIGENIDTSRPEK
jgi:hypothetical protein